MKKYMLFIAADGICDMDETDEDINEDGNTIISGYEDAVAERNRINIKNGYGIVG